MLCPLLSNKRKKKNLKSDFLKYLNPELLISGSKQMDLKAVYLPQITESTLVSVIF